MNISPCPRSGLVAFCTFCEGLEVTIFAIYPNPEAKPVERISRSKCAPILRKVISQGSWADSPGSAEWIGLACLEPNLTPGAFTDALALLVSELRKLHGCATQRTSEHCVY